MERLQKIIAKLESKLQPLHDENQLLKSKLEDLQLDHELALEQAKAAELELAEVTQHNQRISELENQVEALETLKKLSDELEKDQREEILMLESQLTELQSEYDQSTQELPLKQEKSILQSPVNDLNDTYQQQLGLLRLELDAARYELKAQQIGHLNALHEQVDFNLPLLRFLITVYGKDKDDLGMKRVHTLFDSFKVGAIGNRDVKDSLELLIRELNAESSLNPKFDGDAARKYVFEACNDARVLELSDNAIAKVMEDNSLIDELYSSEKNIDVITEQPNVSDSAEVVPIIDNEETEMLKLKLEVLTEKAARANKFAAALEKAKKDAQETEQNQRELLAQLHNLRSQISVKEDEIATLEAAQAPALDTVTYRHTIELLSDTIKLLHKKKGTLSLEPLTVGPARNLSALAGSEVVNQIWDALDTFKAPTRKQEWAEQLRKTSLIDA